MLWLIIIASVMLLAGAIGLNLKINEMEKEINNLYETVQDLQDFLNFYGWDLGEDD